MIDGVAMSVAVVNNPTPQALDVARTITHDRLIDQLGDLRRSGVSWMIAGRDEAMVLVTEQNFPQAASLRLALLRATCSVLVVAMCEAARPEHGLTIDDGTVMFGDVEGEPITVENMGAMQEIRMVAPDMN